VKKYAIEYSLQDRKYYFGNNSYSKLKDAIFFARKAKQGSWPLLIQIHTSIYRLIPAEHHQIGQLIKPSALCIFFNKLFRSEPFFLSPAGRRESRRFNVSWLPYR
jgi:hypothetical protein